MAAELIKLTSAGDNNLNIFHFRTSDNKEIDFVLEKPNGQLAAIEVKSRDHVNASDFIGLKVLQQLTGNDFICGIVLYRGREVVPFGKNLWAVPFSVLWQ